MEKTIEFDTIKDFSNNTEVNDKNIDTLSMHYDKTKNKYITTIKYGKKTR